MKKKKLRVLIVEDSPDDALLIAEELERGGLLPDWVRVQDAEEMTSALTAGNWDVILADYALPGFTALDALAIYVKSELDIPFLVVSGTVGEDIAVETMKLGAHDYLMKGNLTRLVSAIKRELHEADIRKQHRKAQKEVKRVAREWQATFDAITDYINIIDIEGRITRCNKAFCTFLGIPEHKIVGRHCWELIHYRTEPVKDCPFHRMKKSKKREILIIQQGKKYYQISVDPIFNEKKELIGGVHIMSDITLQQKAEEVLKTDADRLAKRVLIQTKKLEKAQEDLIRKEKLAVLGQLAGSIGHELRNPLGVMANAVYCLQEMFPEKDKRAQKYITMLTGQIVNADRIITALMGLSRSEPVNMCTITPKELLIKVLEGVTIPKNVTCTVTELESGRMLVIDSEQIVQALLNVIRNALQAMPNGGDITITVKKKKDTIVILVADSGEGIAKKSLKRIYEPLFSTKIRGIGLGLPLARNLIEINKGSLVITSEEGKGTTVEITLPAERSK